jgi:hypothetical protein
VADLQRQVELKEAEVLRMKEMLARNDATDITAAQIELNRLQAAFDHCSKQSDSKLEPVTQKFQQTHAQYESKKYRMKTFHTASKERDSSVRSMQSRIDVVTSELDAPDDSAVDTTAVTSLLQESQRLQSEIESIHRTKQWSSYAEKTCHHVNEVLSRTLREASDLEARAARHADLTRQETAMRANRPLQTIDDEWVLARHTMDKLRLMLEDARRSTKFLNDTADQLANSNRRVQEDVKTAEQELVELKRFTKIAATEDVMKKSDVAGRIDVSVAEMQRDFGEVLLNLARLKTQAVRGSLETLRAKAEELPELVQGHEEDAGQVRIEREIAENSVKKAQLLRAELLSRKVFAQEEEELLGRRLEEQHRVLEEVKGRTRGFVEELQRQKTIMLLNEEMQNLKTMNFDRFTSTIANVMSIRSRME